MASSCFPWNQSRPITNAPFRKIVVQHLPGNPRMGRLRAGVMVFPCALGKGGVTRRKNEGDGATPLGTYSLRKLWYRRAVGKHPFCRLPLQAIASNDGWCDAPSHRLYNKPIKRPFHASHERMWRDDKVYDTVIEIGWNDRPAIPGRGSAIFFHLARAGFSPTEGCVAISAQAMRKILPRIGTHTRFEIA